MQAILYIAHGTRLQAGVDEAIRFIEEQMALTDIPIQHYSFIDLASPSIEEGIQACVDQGASKITFIPILLLAAAHAKEDLPNAIRHATKMYPNISFSYGKPFGVNDYMIDTIIERILDKGDLTESSAILLVGRGSSDRTIMDEFAKIKAKLTKKTGVEEIDVCYLAALKPHLTEGIANQVKNNAKQIFVVPYLLFTGLLMRHLEETIRVIDLSHKDFILCEPLGRTDAITDLLSKRIEQAVDGEVVLDALSSTFY